MSSRKYIIVLITYIFLSYSVFLFLDKEMIIRLTEEDGFYESCGARFLLMASIFFFIKFWQDKSGNDFQFIKIKKYFSSSTIHCFFVGFGEEINWGQRLFNFKTPAILMETNVQKVISIHNINLFCEYKGTPEALKPKYAYLLSIHRLFNAFWFFYCLVIPIFNRIIPTLNSFLKKINLPIVPIWIGVFFMANYLIAKCVSFLIPLKAFGNVCEILECNYAFLFMIVAIYLYQNNKSVKNNEQYQEI